MERRAWWAAAAGALMAGGSVLAVAHQASAHGSMQNPVSRVYTPGTAAVWTDTGFC
jgi:predicted carbohydrate-binding protein with CBM5 and CBM33 domain